MSTGAGQHWFVVFRFSQDILEIFDSLGGNLSFYQEVFVISALYEYNLTPVQCSGSVQCGPFVVYFIILRYFNLDLELVDFLNEFFSLNCAANEKIVREFLNQL